MTRSLLNVSRLHVDYKLFSTTARLLVYIHFYCEMQFRNPLKISRSAVYFQVIMGVTHLGISSQLHRGEILESRRRKVRFKGYIHSYYSQPKTNSERCLSLFTFSIKWKEVCARSRDSRKTPYQFNTSQLMVAKEAKIKPAQFP